MPLKLNPQMETLFLIYLSNWGEEEKEKAINELESLGLGGEAFYTQNFAIVEKYYAVFQENLIESPGTRFFASLSKPESVLFAVYTYIFWKHQDWFNGIEHIPEAALIKAVEDVCISELEMDDPSKFVESLEASGFSSETKWQLMLLKQQPGKQLQMIAEAVGNNLPAFEKARHAVSDELDKFISSLERTLNNPQKSYFLQNTYKLTEGVQIIPTMALPAAAVAFDNVVFYGMFVHTFAGMPAEFTKDELLRCAKVLGEKSKLEILLALKDNALYSGELAEKVGITPATVSHHINALLTAGLITLERNDGRLYPKLLPQGVQRFIDGVSELLLMGK